MRSPPPRDSTRTNTTTAARPAPVRADLHSVDFLPRELALRQHARDRRVHDGGLLGGAAGEGVPQALAQLPGGARGRGRGRGLDHDNCCMLTCTCLPPPTQNQHATSPLQDCFFDCNLHFLPAGHTWARLPVWSTLHSSSVPLSAISSRCTSNRGAPACGRTEGGRGRGMRMAGVGYRPWDMEASVQRRCATDEAAHSTRGADPCLCLLLRCGTLLSLCSTFADRAAKQ